MSWNNDDNAGGGDADVSGGSSAWGAGGNNAGSGDAGSGGGGGKTCRICNQEGHFSKDCPDKPEGGLTGECYNCGQVGHNKSDCPNPRVDRPFTGTCNSCGEEGHRAGDCPTNPGNACRLCGNHGHKAVDCKERRLMDWTGVPELDPEEAWTKLIDAACSKDIDPFKISLKAYARAVGNEFNLPDVEIALRESNIPMYLKALTPDNMAQTLTIVDLVGLPDRQFILTIQHQDKPRRPKLAVGWPKDAADNLERLKSAGFPQDRGVPLCRNCGNLGHISKSCPEEKVERERTAPEIICSNCKEEGHRIRNCPKPRINYNACKNCGQEGHRAADCTEPRSAANVTCNKCEQMGHFGRDCPNVEARPPRACRNCGSEDHIAKECDQPLNPDNVTCRNCEKQGHFSRDCPEPKDWSKVKCQNCGEMGHTIKRCKAAMDDGDAGGDGGWGANDDAANTGTFDGGDAGVSASGGW